MFEVLTINISIPRELEELRCRTLRKIFRKAHCVAFFNKRDGNGHPNIMKFPIIIHKDPNSDHGVTVPDLPGCFSAGSTVDEALSNAIEAIECHIEGMLQDGENVPIPRTVEHYSTQKHFRGGVWALVEVDVTKLSGKAKRVNITLPERMLVQIDAFAARRGETRSGLLATAAMEYVAAHGKD